MWGRADRAVKLLGRNIPSVLRMTEGVDPKISRRLCVKPQQDLQKKSRSASGVPGYRPTPWERRFLLWAGHYKKPEDIPDTVSWKVSITATLLVEDFWFFKDNSRVGNTFPNTYSYWLETVRAAQSTLRVRFSYVMIALTIVGCITMVIRGKQAMKRHESLTNLNLEKKAKLREEGASAKP